MYECELQRRLHSKDMCGQVAQCRDSPQTNFKQSRLRLLLREKGDWELLDDNVKHGEDKPIALCFCGPSALAHTVGRAAADVGGELEYSADHQ